jgi:hypothetical protein
MGRNRSKTEIFIEKAKKLYGDKYDYSKTVYIHSKQKVEIICPDHGSFMQEPGNHLSNFGCIECGVIRRTNKLINNGETRRKIDSTIDINFYIIKANKKYGGKYDYSLIKYLYKKTKINIICPEHGIFKQDQLKHLNGAGCPKCDLKFQFNEFIEKSNIIFLNKYIYSKVDYINSFSEVTIICPEHGEFNIEPINHLNGYGCPKCKDSHNKEISTFLDKANIKYITHKSFDIWENEYKIIFDFYLPDHNILIEYNEKHHYKPDELFGGDAGFRILLKDDNIKNLYCNRAKIPLIVIPYHKDTTWYLENELKKYNVI